jgi:hypothetical protein
MYNIAFQEIDIDKDLMYINIINGIDKDNKYTNNKKDLIEDDSIINNNGNTYDFPSNHREFILVPYTACQALIISECIDKKDIEINKKKYKFIEFVDNVSCGTIKIVNFNYDGLTDLFINYSKDIKNLSEIKGLKKLEIKTGDHFNDQTKRDEDTRRIEKENERIEKENEDKKRKLDNITISDRIRLFFDKNYLKIINPNNSSTINWGLNEKYIDHTSNRIKLFSTDDFYINLNSKLSFYNNIQFNLPDSQLKSLPSMYINLKNNKTTRYADIIKANNYTQPITLFRRSINISNNFCFNESLVNLEKEKHGNNDINEIFEFIINKNNKETNKDLQRMLVELNERNFDVTSETIRFEVILNILKTIRSGLIHVDGHYCLQPHYAEVYNTNDNKQNIMNIFYLLYILLQEKLWKIFVIFF